MSVEVYILILKNRKGSKLKIGRPSQNEKPNFGCYSIRLHVTGPTQSLWIFSGPSIGLFSVDFLDGFETKSPQHTALRPTYVRVASNASPLRSSVQRLTLSRPDHRSLSLNRGSDSIRLCRSDVAVNRMGKSGKESLEYPKVVPRNERRQPRPMSLYASTRFD